LKTDDYVALALAHLHSERLLEISTADATEMLQLLEASVKEDMDLEEFIASKLLN
jgi:hypothetical protein